MNKKNSNNGLNRWLVYINFLATLSAISYGYGILNHKVSSLQEKVEEVRVDTKSISKDVSRIKARLGVIEYRLKMDEDKDKGYQFNNEEIKRP